MKYYLDSCIWLNLLKKEEDKNKTLWKIAKKFILTNKNDIIISGIVIKEIKFVLNYEFKNLDNLFNKFDKYKTNNIDYSLARNIEKEFETKISFYDYLHIAICKNNNFVLITRDKEMIKIARKYINVYLPEDLL